LIAPSSWLHDGVIKKQKASLMVTKETATMATSEAISIPEPPNVFIYNKDTKDAIPRNVTHVRVDPSVKEIHDTAFQYYPSLVEVEFSEGLEVIGRDAFSDCTELKSINKLPSTLKEVGDGAFNNCESLDFIDFPEGLQVIGEDAFRCCRALKRIKIPSAHLVIRESAFSECYGLVSVELPEGLQVIGKAWFYACMILTTVNVPSSVIEIQDSAFSDCTSLASLALPKGLQYIGKQSFAGCESLSSLHIPFTVYTMGARVFWGCTRLEYIHIPSSDESIGASAFDGCEQHVHLQRNLHTIKEGTFYGCDLLTHVRLPSSVKKVECAAFAHCPRLISLELPEGMEIIDLRVRERVRYDPEDRADEGGPEFRNYGCPSLMNVVIPSEQHFAQLNDDDDEFMKGFKLGTAASNFDDLVGKLQHRFDTLPVHRLCYYQSYYPLTEAMENLQQNMDADPSAGTKVDSFGMTPFHILALSQTPNLSLFQALLAVYQVDIIRTRDKFGSTPIDYLFLNYTHEATTAIQSLFPTILVNHFHWLGLVRWQSEHILTLMNEALAVGGSSRTRAVGLLLFKLATYERLESMSLLELALWKGKVDGCKAAIVNDRGRDKERSPKRPRFDKSRVAHVDRQSCRINSGAEVVISNVLPFLDEFCLHDYYSEDSC
jgi:hypothetical protein